MSAPPDRLRRLQAIADLHRDIDLAELARLAERRNALAAERAALREAASASLRMGQEAIATAQVAVAYLAFIDGRDRGLAQEEHSAEAAIAIQKARAAISFGRAQVIGKLGGR